MKVIYKYRFKVESDFTLPDLPRSATIIHVGLDPQDAPAIWAEVFTEWIDEPKYREVPSKRTFAVVGTGQEVPPGGHIGSWRSDTNVYIWHLFETTKHSDRL